MWKMLMPVLEFPKKCDGKSITGEIYSEEFHWIILDLHKIELIIALGTIATFHMLQLTFGHVLDS